MNHGCNLTYDWSTHLAQPPRALLYFLVLTLLQVLLIEEWVSKTSSNEILILLYFMTFLFHVP